jgi:hypothetical protein
MSHAPEGTAANDGELLDMILGQSCARETGVTSRKRGTGGWCCLRGFIAPPTPTDRGCAARPLAALGCLAPLITPAIKCAVSEHPLADIAVGNALTTA